MAIFVVLRFSPISFLMVCILLSLSRGVMCLGWWWSFLVFRLTISDSVTETCHLLTSNVNIFVFMARRNSFSDMVCYPVALMDSYPWLFLLTMFR
jgi:hypothetical protein